MAMSASGSSSPAGFVPPPRELLAHLADFVPQLVWIADPNGYVTWYNQRWYDYTGLTHEESKGRRWQKLVDPEQLPAVQARWEHCLKTGEPYESIFNFRGADGVTRPFLVRGLPMRDAAGAITHWFGTCTDVADQHANEDRLRRRNQRLRLLSDAAAHVLTAVDQEHMVRALYEQVAEHLQLDAYFNFMVNETGDALELDSCAGINDAQRAQLSRLEFGQAICGCVAQERLPMIVTQIQQSNDPRVELVKGYGIRAYACNPLMAGANA